MKMKLHLGSYWWRCIEDEIASGRYGSAGEVVCAALHELERRNKALAALRAHVAEGAAQADRGEFIEGFSMKAVIAQADRDP